MGPGSGEGLVRGRDIWPRSAAAVQEEGVTHLIGSSCRQEGTHEGLKDPTCAKGEQDLWCHGRHQSVNQHGREERAAPVNGKARTAHREGFTIKVADS